MITTIKAMMVSMIMIIAVMKNWFQGDPAGFNNVDDNYYTFEKTIENVTTYDN